MSSMQPTRPFYRSYELPWSGDPESRQRLRRWLTWGLVVLAVSGVVFPLLPPPPVSSQDNAIPERLARVMIENKPKPPPPPPPPPKVEEVKPKEPEKKLPVPPKEPPKDVAHQKAQKQLKAIKDELADIRQLSNLSALSQRNLTGAVDADSRAERSYISRNVGASSGGIGSAPISRNFGGGAGSLGSHDVGAVSSTIARSSLDGRPATRTGSSGKAGRSREEIETVFDRNKGAIYALYNRALRENPGLQGKMVLEFTISPSGEVTMCRVISTELNNKDLEEKIIARVKLFHFEPKPVESITTTKPIDFFPA